MQFELIETGSEVRVRTPALELGWSRENGAMVVLALPDGVNVLGHGPQRPGLDVALGTAGGWMGARSFARYLGHRVEDRGDGVEVRLSVGLGPLTIRDCYLARGEQIERRVEVENVGLDDLRLFGLRLVLPNARVGNAQACRLEAPGNSVRPRVALAVAAAQRREVLPRRFFAPGVRGGSAFEPAPTQGPGLLALHGGPPTQTLLCWYRSARDVVLPYVEGADGWLDAVSLAHEVALVGWLRPGEQLTAGAQHLALVALAWGEARTRIHADLQAAGQPAAWVRDTPLYLSSAARHGGLAGLAAAVPALARLGVGALVLRPVHATAAGQTLDLERVAPALGDRQALVALVATAHAAGLRVLLDLALQGCAADSRYLVEHPDWFARDETGAIVVGQPAGLPTVSNHPGVRVPPGCHCFDWRSEDLQAFLLGWACAQVDDLGLDGLRAVAPYDPTLSWSRRTPRGASEGALVPVAWLGALRARLAERSPDLALLATLSGPAFGPVCDAVYDYPAHMMFVHAALGRVDAPELACYLEDLWAVAPPQLARIGFMESHDTAVVNPLADGLRGSRISRMLQAGMALCGFVPSLWSGQEQGEEASLGALLKLWRAEPALRRGTATCEAAPCDSPQVLSVLREHGGRRLLGLMHLGPGPVRVSVALHDYGRAHPPRDLLGLAPLSGEPGPSGLSLDLAPFSAYCVEV